MDELLVFGVLGITLMVLVTGGMFFVAFETMAEGTARKQSCNEIGMEYFYQDGTTFCVDNNDEAHYVKIDCNKSGFNKYNCNARIISIGNARTVEQEV